MREILAPVLDRLFDEGTPGRSELARFLAIIMPGIIVVFWSLMTLTNGSLAQALLTRFGVGWRPSPALAAVELPGRFLVLLLLAATATGLGGMMRFVGLAVLHTIARRFSRSLLVVIFLDLLDTSLGLRRHIRLPRSIGGKNDG